jgi:ubiquitin-protein ligase
MTRQDRRTIHRVRPMTRQDRQIRRPDRRSRQIMASRGATARYQPWYERWPERKAWEKARFDAHGLPWAEIPEAKQNGYLVVKSEVPFRGDQLEIFIFYPSEYPEFPPLVVSNPPVLDRHQLPWNGNFCLLERPVDSWPSGTWGAADLIVDRLLSLLRDAEKGSEAVREAEAPIPEPATAFFAYEPGAVVLVPEGFTDIEGDGGKLELTEFDGNRLVLTKVGREKSGAELLAVLGEGKTIRGAWKRLDRYPDADENDGAGVLEWVKKNHPDLLKGPAPPPSPKKKGRRRQKRAQTGMKVVAFRFPEERDYGDPEPDAWLFLGVKEDHQGFLLHSQEATPKQRQRRIPDLEGLPERSVLVIGAGSLGSDVAVQVAKAGFGRIRVLDFDAFEVNNAVRHALGIDASGLDKAGAVRDMCRLANPFAEVEAVSVKFGMPKDPGEPIPMEVLESEAADADVVIETSGLHQLELLVGRVAWEKDTPMISCWLTDGSWAGECVRTVPGRTMCISCFQTEQREGERLQGEAAPEDEAVVIAQGCSHPTVSGSGFDATQTAVEAVRLAIQTVLQTDRYPDPEWDHAVFNFRRSADDPDHRRFDSEQLPPKEDCERCSRGAG